MLALTYGMMPSAKIDRFDIAPPLNMFMKPRKPPPPGLFISARMTLRSTPGMVTNAPIRKTASIAIVKITRSRSSGTLLMFANPASALIGDRPRSFRRGGGLCDRDEDHLASGLRDLLLRALREGVRRD